MEETETEPKRASTFPLFSKYFGVHPQDVVEHVGHMRKEMEDFTDAFKKRIEIELTYSKNLTQVSKVLDKHIKPGTQLATSYVCSAFKVQHEMRSRQAFELAENIKSEIEIMCLQMLKKETSFHKKMEKDMKRFYREAANVEDDHIEALSRFEGINRQMEQMIITKNIMKYTTGIPQQKKVKMISKSMESIKQNKEYEKLYIQAVKNYNKFANAYNIQVTSQLDQAEILVRDQISLQSDCIRKLIVAEASLFKNIEYDIVNISTQMESLDNQQDAETFVEEYKFNAQNRIVSEEKIEEESRRSSYTEKTDYLITAKKIMGKSTLSNSLLYVDEEYFSWMLFNKKNKKLREIVSGIWKELNQRQPKQEQKGNKCTEQQRGQKPNERSSLEESNEEKPNAEGNEAEVKEANENGDKKEQQSKQEEKSLLKSVQKHDWQSDLKEWIETIKVQNPPNLVSNLSEKKAATPLTLQSVFSSFMDIMRVISQLWNVEQFDLEQVNKKLATLEQYMSEHHLYRLIGLLFLEEYRVQLEVLIKNSSCARMCSKVLKSIIKQSQKENDTFTIRGILGLIFTFYWADDKHKRLLYMNTDVYQCEIWKKGDFWEAAIFETAYEEMALFGKQKGETGAETILRQKNIIFSQLASFCHYMVMLGITSKKVRLIVGRYCRLYEMTEQQNKDLSKMITNTSKQYKQTAFQFSLKATEKEKSVINE